MLTYYGNPLVEHFPTHAEQYNQNINGLSWGAANLAWQSVQLFQQYSALALLFGVQALDLRSFAEIGHYDGRRLVGPLVASLYSAVYDAVGLRPDQEAPLIFDDADQSLEGMLDALVENISCGGSAVVAVEPLLKMFDDAGLAC
jgi:phenylalanine ammonia-lyase